MLHALKLLPVYKEKIWGGRNLARLLGKDLPPDLSVGESWEIGDDSVVALGPLAGQKLTDLVIQYGAQLIGTLAGDSRGSFPLLVKFIDAQERLSVQVHPDDEGAQQLEGEGRGKTEMWYVLEAAPGAEIVHGFDSSANLDITRLSEPRRLVQHLHHVPVRSGDVVFIPAGTVHAMGAGLVVCEVQQNCDLTYRLYDWDRLTAEGVPRELHVQKALKVCRSGPTEHKIEPVVLEEPFGQRRILMACRYFAVETLTLIRPYSISTDGRSFRAIVGLQGEMRVASSERIAAGEEALSLAAGESIVIPASAGTLSLEPRGACEILLAYVPDLSLDIVQPLVAADVSRQEILCLGGDNSANDLLPLLEL